MNILKKYKTEIFISLILISIVTFSFFIGGENPTRSTSSAISTESLVSKNNIDTSAKDNEENKVSDDAIAETENQTIREKNKIKENISDVENNAKTDEENSDYIFSSESETEISFETDTEQYSKEYAQGEKDAPSQSENVATSDKELYCTFSVKCDTILDNISKLDKEKHELVPEDGVIFSEKKVVFYEGESVFDLLLREMRKNKIHLEFVNTPIYDSAYIEGIANIYEFDCGELSGWMYKVNGWFPECGCSRYQINEGDKIEWIYTCDLGRDIGK